MDSILRMDLVDREGGGGTVADDAAFSKRGRVRQCVGSGRDLDVTASACRGDRLDRIDRPLRIGNRVETRGQVLLAAVGMAHGAVACVGGRAGRAQRWEQRRAEVIVAPTKSNDHVASIESLQVDSVMNPMNQQIKVDALRGRGKVGWDLRGDTHGSVGIGRIVAQHAIFRVVAQRAMQR